MRARPRRISCDASVRNGHAGIAAVLEGRDVRILFLDVLRDKSTAQAERMAIEKAMNVARRAGWRSCVFRTDTQGLKIHSKMLDGWRVEEVPRKHNVAAHTCARQALKLWESGRLGLPTIAADGTAKIVKCSTSPDGAGSSMDSPSTDSLVEDSAGASANVDGRAQ